MSFSLEIFLTILLLVLQQNFIQANLYDEKEGPYSDAEIVRFIHEQSESIFSRKQNRIDLENFDQKSFLDWIESQQQVCYDHLGCFSLKGPLGHTRHLPDSPEKIGIHFFAYSNTLSTNSTSQYNKEMIVSDEKFGTFEKLLRRDRSIAILIHGFQNSAHSKLMLKVKTSLLKYARETIGTVIVVDWQQGAKAPFYLKACANTQVVGHRIALFVERLRRTFDFDPKKVHLIGYSLGAQIAGFAGKFSQSEFHWRFGRITALDAASPMFESYANAHLTKNDADFVDAIHTSCGGVVLDGDLGFTKPFAHIDFYPNGGLSQPECGFFSQLVCKHRASVLFFEASLSGNGKFYGHPCKTFESFEKGECKRYDSEMGYYAFRHNTSFGLRYLRTKAEYPYSESD